MASSIGASAMPCLVMTATSTLMSWPILSTDGSSSSGFRMRERLGHRRPASGASPPSEVAARSMVQRHVARLARRQRQGDAAQLARDDVRRRRPGAEGDEALRARVAHPALQRRLVLHQLVFAEIERRGRLRHGQFGFRHGGQRGAGNRGRGGRRGVDLRPGAIPLAAVLGQDAGRERAELVRLHEVEQPADIELAPFQAVERRLQRNVAAQRHQPLGDARQLGIGEQVLAPLGLLDLAARAPAALPGCHRC